MEHESFYPQHFLDFCTGGHGTEPYEQNTQQSPSLGRMSALHVAHS
jgi:hypothetical protein